VISCYTVRDLERLKQIKRSAMAQCFPSQGSLFVPLVVGTSDSFTPAAKKMEGCYLYFDREEAEWI
jgi:fatty acid/phospholipid biosynthesis enzyme